MRVAWCYLRSTPLLEAIVRFRLGLGDYDQSLEYLERAYEEHSWQLLWRVISSMNRSD